MADTSLPDQAATEAGAPSGTLFKVRSIGTRFDLAAAMRWARQTHGVGIWRQVREIFALAARGERLTPREYYEYALFRRTIGATERAAYVSFSSQLRLNRRLSPRSLLLQNGLLADKLLCGLVLDRAGFPTVATLAAHAPGLELPGLRVLSSPEALARWLLDEAPLPVFGKLRDGSLGLGGVSIVARAGDRLTLGDGRDVRAAELAAEVARMRTSGWLVQPLLRLHPEVAALAGTAVAMLRLVTLRDAQGPAPLYALLRLPAAGAMIDANQAHGPNGNVAVDLATGALGRAQSNWRMNTAALETSTATGVPLAGRRLPFVPEAARLAVAVHRLFPAHGVLGFDFALTAEGPVIGEINASPHHHNWQRAHDRGLLNPDFAPRFAAAEAESRRRVKAERAEAARIAGKRQ